MQLSPKTKVKILESLDIFYNMRPDGISIDGVPKTKQEILEFIQTVDEQDIDKLSTEWSLVVVLLSAVVRSVEPHGSYRKPTHRTRGKRHHC